MSRRPKPIEMGDVRTQLARLLATQRALLDQLDRAAATQRSLFVLCQALARDLGIDDGDDGAVRRIDPEPQKLVQVRPQAPAGAKVTREQVQSVLRAASVAQLSPASRIGTAGLSAPAKLEGIPSGEMMVLRAIAQYRGTATIAQIRISTGFMKKTVGSYVQRLKKRTLVDRDRSLIVLTRASEGVLADQKPLPSGEALRSHLLSTLPVGEATVFRQLAHEYPGRLSRELIVDRTGFTAKTVDSYLQRLKTRAVIVRDGRLFHVAHDLFPTGTGG